MSRTKALKECTFRAFAASIHFSDGEKKLLFPRGRCDCQFLTGPAGVYFTPIQWGAPHIAVSAQNAAQITYYLVHAHR
jgi:hypothetical protein